MFVGRALQAKPLSKWLHETEFAVAKSWRGVRSPRITVRSDLSVLGPVFEAGQDYLVFAYRISSSHSWLEAVGCATTSRLSEAGPWLTVLGKPRYVPPGRVESAPK